jgi:hypothetical protein
MIKTYLLWPRLAAFQCIHFDKLRAISRGSGVRTADRKKSNNRGLGRAPDDILQRQEPIGKSGRSRLKDQRGFDFVKLAVADCGNGIEPRAALRLVVIVRPAE